MNVLLSILKFIINAKEEIDFLKIKINYYSYNDEIVLRCN